MENVIQLKNAISHQRSASHRGIATTMAKQMVQRRHLLEQLNVASRPRLPLYT